MGQIPDRYKPDGEISSGGFGTVFFCQDQVLLRRVAIKFIQEAFDKKRLLDEIHALQKLRSKHVVQIYDIVVDQDGDIGIVEEFIDGKDLWDHPFPKQSTENYLKTLWQISSGLSDIHAENIIHRDIKPNNIKLDSENIVKIYDLGFAREEGPKAKTKGFVGTVRFAAPELYGTDTVTFSKAIDVYAFGATAYFLSGDELPQELCKIPPNPLPAGSFHGMSVKIPAELASLFGQCLEHDPAARPEMADVRDKIARYLLQDKHQALTILNEKPSYLNAERKSVRLEYSGVGKIQIAYDGLRFKVKSVEGEIYINNQGVVVGAVLPGSCVIAFGAAHRPANQRGFVTFDISNPEVVV